MEKLGIDLDGVVYNFHDTFRKWLECELDRELPPLSGSDPELHAKEWMLDKKAWWKHFDQCARDGTLFESGDPIPGALDGLNALNDAGYRISFVTTRPERYRDSTVRWLQKYGITYDALLMVEDKATAEVDLLLDDFTNNVMAFLATGRPAILYTQPWNREMDMVRVNSWREFTKQMLFKKNNDQLYSFLHSYEKNRQTIRVCLL